MYKFWLSNRKNSNDSRCNVVNISKRTFPQHYRFITDERLMEKEVHLKSGTKKVFYNGRKIYTDSLRALHRTFNSTQAENVLFSAFYTYKPYYVSKPTEKEKEACMCIDCLNPHLLLKSINAYRKSINLHEYQSSTTYLNELKVDSDNYDLFPETKMKKKYATMLMNGNSSATKEKMEMYSIPQQPELIKETRCLQ